MPATPPLPIKQHSSFLKLILITGSVALRLLLSVYYRFTPVRHKARTRVLIRHDDYVLLVRNVGDENHWGLLGGGVKPNEPPLKSVAREVYEELSIKLPESSFEYAAEYSKDSVKDAFAMICYTVTTKDDIAVNKLSIELIEAHWFAHNALPANAAPVVKLLLNDVL